MNITSLEIPDVLLIEHDVYHDERGFFFESWNKRNYSIGGLSTDFVQINHSSSSRGTLRGLHYQICHSQGKLIKVAVGCIFDVVVDLRRSSATFGQHVSIHLNADNFQSLWVPSGFAHGFCVMSDKADIMYHCTDYYAPECERTLLWNDPVLAIQWPKTVRVGSTLSAKDQLGKSLASADCFD